MSEIKNFSTIEMFEIEIEKRIHLQLTNILLSMAK